MTGLYYVLLVMVGASLGSFVAATLDRVKRGESIVWPPSHCTSCDRPIKPWENVPMISFVALRGRCTGCKAGIPISYWIWEMAGAIAGATSAWLITR